MFPVPEIRKASAQGKYANFTGQVLEKKVAMLLDECGYQQLKEKLVETQNQYYIHQFKHFQSIYGGILCVDFFVWSQNKYPSGLVIECKSQAIAGSVDEKYPYTINNLKETKCPAILIIEGNGPKAGALAWCKKRADENEWFRFYHGYHAFQTAVRKEGLL